VKKGRNAYYRAVIAEAAESYLEPLIDVPGGRGRRRQGRRRPVNLRVDDELHLTPLRREDQMVKFARLADPGWKQLRIAFGSRSQVRISWIMLGREPRSDKELLMVYAGILAHAPRCRRRRRRA